MKLLKLASRSRKANFSKPAVVRVWRTEIQESTDNPNWRELDHWLLWAGISPEAGMPVSHIGIYTDFT